MEKIFPLAEKSSAKIENSTLGDSFSTTKDTKGHEKISWQHDTFAHKKPFP